MRATLRSTLFVLALLAPRGAFGDPPHGADLEPLTPPEPPAPPGAASAPLPRLVDIGPPRVSSEARGVATRTRDYLRGMQRDAFPSYVAGSPGYYATAAREAQRVWQPATTQPPGVPETIAGNFVASPEVSMNAMRRSMGSTAAPQMMAAGDSLDAAHPNSPMLAARNTGSGIAEATARTTRVVLRVDQDASGRVVAVAVERTSTARQFDARAMDAVRAALAAQPGRAMPGGWRSYWEFAVVDSRDPLIVALPGLPGDPPLVTPGWVEMTSDGEVHAPLATHRRRRVRLLSSERLDAR